MKTVYTLNINNYEPQITELTYPLMKVYADKIGAGFYEINRRKFPGWPVSYEKLQIFDFARDNDWNIFFDADTLIHPDTIDFTLHMNKNTVYHNSNDMAHLRYVYDEYFLRDGRNIGSGNWVAFASDWCADLWRPLDINLEEALSNIRPTHEEIKGGLEKNHFIDGYAVSRNIARFGLHFYTIENLLIDLDMGDERFFWHGYNMSAEQKRLQMISVMKDWGI